MFTPKWVQLVHLTVLLGNNHSNWDLNNIHLWLGLTGALDSISTATTAGPSTLTSGWVKLVHWTVSVQQQQQGRAQH